MVAVNGSRMIEQPSVSLVAGDQASGLANMIGQYLEQILNDSPEKRAEAVALRGRLGLRAREGDVAVTVEFSDGGIVIEEGLREPDAIVGGEVEYLLHVLAGRANPAWEMRRGRVNIQPQVHHPLFAYQTYHFMRLPGVHVWSGLPRPPRRVIVCTAALVGAGVIVWGVRRRSGSR